MQLCNSNQFPKCIDWKTKQNVHLSFCVHVFKKYFKVCNNGSTFPKYESNKIVENLLHFELKLLSLKSSYFIKVRCYKVELEKLKDEQLTKQK